MAQRTGADGFLALKVKVASAGVLLALAAAAALLLAGCGGGSEDQTQGTSAVAGSPSEATGQGQGAKEEGAAKAGEGEGKGAAQGKGKSSSSQGAAKAKQGPGIAPPKGPRVPEATPAELANSTIADISLESPGLGGEGAIALPSRYTCEGEGSWPELRWSGVPADTKELILLVMALEPVGGELSYSWAVAGLDPGLEGIEAGKLPKGAIVGQNSFGKAGYEICPQGKAETYVFALYALPRALSPKRGFDPDPLRDQVLDVSGNVGLMAVVGGG